MKKSFSYLAALMLALSITSAAFAQTDTTAPTPPDVPASSAPAPTNQNGTAGHGMHHHPHLHKAKHALENAKKALQEAASDYDGHRTKAIEDIDAALEEVNTALTYPSN